MSYRNTHNAIGYTFRYYATQMHTIKRLNYWAIKNDAAPSSPVPILVTAVTRTCRLSAYMVTRTSPQRKHKSWWTGFAGPQGSSWRRMYAAVSAAK
ncbi:hypothetical protein KCP69_04845 [Salmonella enterica subsp. enterica]|nr:hypothetical protein KCP69_04845 [Salmonella enterica subsp. enterica]